MDYFILLIGTSAVSAYKCGLVMDSKTYPGALTSVFTSTEGSGLTQHSDCFFPLLF